MNRTKIEEMLKEAKSKQSRFIEKRNGWKQNSIHWESYDLVVRELEEVINSLTSLLAEDGGEVKDASIVELGDIANRAVQEVLNKGGKLTSEEQFALTQMFIELGEVFYSKLPPQQAPSEKQPIEIEDVSHTIHFADSMDNEAPSARVDENTQSIAELIFSVATNADETVESRVEWIKREMLDTLVARVKNSQQPTVDEKHLSSEQRQQLFDFIFSIADYMIMDNEMNSIESIVYPKTYPYTLKDSQQPTVDVAKEIADDVQQTLECSDKYRNVIEKRISEALRGTYSKEDMIAFGVKVLNGDNGKFRPFVVMTLNKFNEEKDRRNERG